jgi:hypothetical protein
MIEIIPFKPEHPRMMENPRNDWMYLEQPWIDQYIQYVADSGLACSAIFKGKVVGCAGAILLRDGEAEAWMLLDHWLDNFPLEIHRTMTTGLQVIKDYLGLHRLQAMVSCDSPQNYHKWMSRLGFKHESKCENYGPLNGSYERYAIEWR